MNDLVRLAMERAADKFGGHDGTFSAAGFGVEFYRLLGLKGSMDGIVVRGVLTGRSDVEALRGGAHFRLLWVGP